MKFPDVHRILAYRPSRRVTISIVVVVGVCVVVVGASAAVRTTYYDRILPHVTLGGVPVGGLTQGEAITKVQAAYDTMLTNNLALSHNGSTKTVGLRVSSDESSYALLDMDVPTEVARAFGVGRYSNHKLESQIFPMLHSLGIRSENISANVTTREEQLTGIIRDAFPDIETSMMPTDFTFSDTDGAITISPAKNGTAIDFDRFFLTLHNDVGDLMLTPQIIKTTTLASDISTDDAKTLLDAASKALSAAPYTVAYTSENRTEPETWTVTKMNLMDWLVPSKNDNGSLVLGLEKEKMTGFFTELHDGIDVDAQNARFSMTNNVVQEFAPSHDGVTVNNDATAQAITDFLGTENTEILVMVDVVHPDVTTETVNNLGIKEILGVGTSDFKNSPSNRIKNIKHGAEKLNGLLIAPGEITSLLEKLRPFTVEDGYLPELVIKGTEIKPEVGGGLCQIGTTTFRAVMNSGLHVVERRNHSLVVSYYNDPSNNNPGTDATIYDPSPDFKFENDTANYILLTTEVNETDKKLYFTFWGTSDNRKASYSPPQVLSWSGYGDPVNTETDTLAPGVEKCQAAHPGATTTFTYTVVYADGTTHSEDFFSSYRSLPKICLVGKAATTETLPSDTTSDVTESPITTE